MYDEKVNFAEIFWKLKHLYPGDPEFSLDNYWQMPYNYVLQALENGIKEERRKLHFHEAPIALQTLLLANINRDPKKQRQPYALDEFFFYQDLDDLNRPAGIYGAAALKLVDLKKFPSWALFAFKALRDGASGPPPPELAYISDDCIVLAPKLEEDKITGMIIGMESSSGQIKVLQSLSGKTFMVEIPEIKGKYYCEENTEIKLLLSS